MRGIFVNKFFFLCLFYSSISFGQTINKIDFLIDQKRYLNLIHQINISRSKHLVFCLQNPEKTFFKSYFKKINVLGTVEYSCEKALKKIFKRRIKEGLTNMRLFLALSRPKIRKDSFDRERESERGRNLSYKINIDIEHPHTSAFLINFDGVGSLEALSPSEAEAAMKLHDEFTKEKCTQYRDENLENRISIHSRSNKLKKEKLEMDLCKGPPFKQLISEKNKFIRSIKKVLLDEYFQWLLERRKLMRKDYLMQYYKLINHSPYFVYLRGADPTNEEIGVGIEIIHKNALRQLEILREYTRSKNMDRRITSYKEGYLDRDEEEELKNDLLYYYKDAKISGFSDLNRNLTESEELYEANRGLFDELKQESEDYRSTQMWKNLGLIVLAYGSCFLPYRKVYRALKIARKWRSGPASKKVGKRVKNSCFVTFGLPLNSYFLYDSISIFRNHYSQFMGSPDGVYLMNQFENLDADKKAIIITSLTLGIGVGPIKDVFKFL